MPDISCSDWDESIGACIKHSVPQILCPACLAEKNPNIQVYFTIMDREFIGLERLFDSDSSASLRDLLPVGDQGDFLMQQAT